MKSITATWFECKARFEQTQDDGIVRKVTEQYVVDAMSFAEAEARITEELRPYISSELEITSVKKAPYNEVIFMNEDSQSDERWYKGKLEFITICEKTGKEKRSAVIFLVQARSLHNALENIDTTMKGSMANYVQANVGETKVVDVLLHTVPAEKETT